METRMLRAGAESSAKLAKTLPNLGGCPSKLSYQESPTASCVICTSRITRSTAEGRVHATNCVTQSPDNNTDRPATTMVAIFQQVGGADDRMFFAPVRSASRADKEKLAETPSVGVKVMAPWTNGCLLYTSPSPRD